MEIIGFLLYDFDFWVVFAGNGPSIISKYVCILIINISEGRANFVVYFYLPETDIKFC